MKEEWVSGEMKFSSATEWVNDLCETLTKLHEITRRKESRYKTKVKEKYDERAVFREYKPGAMVLLHTPLLMGKLELVWQGPYEVSKRISDTTYQLSVPEKRLHKVVAHVNRLKPWKAPSTSLFRVVVAQDSEGSDHPIGRVNLGEENVTEEQRRLLQAMLKKHKWTVVSGSLWKAPKYTHVIATGESTPVRSHPYRIVPGWKEELKEEVMKLLKQGIIKPSQCPWSSPMVPIRKPNGCIRLCIDYRRLNSVTMEDPYEMPHISDLLDKVAEARWLFKLDLNQGFYQIPMNQDSIAKTAFCSPRGKFAFTRMPFGVTKCSSYLPEIHGCGT